MKNKTEKKFLWSDTIVVMVIYLFGLWIADVKYAFLVALISIVAIQQAREIK